MVSQEKSSRFFLGLNLGEARVKRAGLHRIPAVADVGRAPQMAFAAEPGNVRVTAQWWCSLRSRRLGLKSLARVFLHLCLNWLFGGQNLDGEVPWESPVRPSPPACPQRMRDLCWETSLPHTPGTYFFSPSIRTVGAGHTLSAQALTHSLSQILGAK